MNWFKKYILEKKQNQILKVQAIEATDLVFESRDGKLITPILGDDMSLSQSVPIPSSVRITAVSDEYQSDDTQPAELQLLGAPDRKIQQPKPSIQTKSELGLVT